MHLSKLVFYISSVILLSACGSSSDDAKDVSFGQASYSATIDEDNSASIALTSINGSGSVTYSLSNAPSEGMVDINASTGALVYTPSDNFNGTVDFQVAVSSGLTSSSAPVSITVTAINDLPEIVDNTVLVSGAEIKQGQILAADVDGDTLTFAVTAEPTNGVITLNSATGAFSYIANALTIINDSFAVDISDGEGGSIAGVISLQASTANNTDRAFYYYASDLSHLKQAQSLGMQLENDINLSLLNQDLAQGYARAGLITQVSTLLNSDNIVVNNIRASTMVNVAGIYESLGIVDDAERLRGDANVIYNQYIASKGLSAFNADDVTFYNTLANSYQSAGDIQGANQALSILDLLFTSLSEDGYSTSILRTFFAFGDIVGNNVTLWQQTQDPVVRDLIISQIERLYRYANIIPARLVSNDRNDNEGAFFHSIRQVAFFDIVDYYISLNEFDRAKSVMADILALHGVVDYDPAHPREADEFAVVTKVEYAFGIAGATPYFVNLYPNDGIDTLLSGLPADSFWNFVVPDDAEDALLMAKIRNESDKSLALQSVLDSRDDEDLRAHFTNLVAFNSSNPGGARILRRLGEFEAALPFLQEGLNLLVSSQYIEQNKGIVLFTIGSSGCGMIMNEALAIYDVTESAEALDLAQSAANSCAQLAEQHYKLGDDASSLTIEDAIDANAALLEFANQLDLSTIQASLIANIDTNLALVSDNPSDLIDLARTAGISLAQGGQLTLAIDYYIQAISALDIIEGNAIVEEIGEETSEFFANARSSSSYTNILLAIEALAGVDDEYSTALQSARNIWSATVAKRLIGLQDANLLQQATYLPQYADQYIRLGDFDSALLLAQSDSLGPVEKQSIITQTASAMASLNQFPNAGVASVDTDLDGLPNFFLADASEESITASQLRLDPDSDNDGTEDGEDSFPLDATKQ